ncbi:unnamed protein product [Phytophthora fragariaefolia]|uniref:Unnamed protein product n=1 Tax=Phytophthora fragariaefolia TaxID=1490495 RepID=A0A9W6XKI1_9STRA|nr:unnamed protein product [Phytophthora fragariaefolia]
MLDMKHVELSINRSIVPNWSSMHRAFGSHAERKFNLPAERCAGGVSTINWRKQQDCTPAAVFYAEELPKLAANAESEGDQDDEDEDDVGNAEEMANDDAKCEIAISPPVTPRRKADEKAKGGHDPSEAGCECYGVTEGKTKM